MTLLDHLGLLPLRRDLVTLELDFGAVVPNHCPGQEQEKRRPALPGSFLATAADVMESEGF